MVRLAILASWLPTCLSSALSISPFHVSSINSIDPTAPGIMALSPEFTVFIGDGTQLLPVLLDSSHPCTFLVGSDIACPGASSCKPLVSFSTSSPSWLNLTGNTTTCQYGSVAKQNPASVSGIAAAGYLGFAGWTPFVNNIVIADQFVSPIPLNIFISGASGVLSMFGTSVHGCNISAFTLNYWPDDVESDGTYLFMAPRRSDTNGPGLISWGKTPTETVLGNANYNMTNTVATTNITGFDAAARAESCGFVVPVDALAFESFGVGTITSDAEEHLLATMSKFNVVRPSFAQDVSDAFEPAGSVDGDGLVRVACDAVPPKTYVKIGGVDLEMNPVDAVVMEEGGVCYSAFQAAAETEVLKLGQPFLKNVALRVGWDLGVELTARPYYAA